MELTPKTYLLIYALIVIPIAISFFFLKRGQQPTKLNLHTKPGEGDHLAPKAAPAEAPPPRAEGKTWPEQERRSQPRPPPSSPPPRPQGGAASQAGVKETSLNVFFNWNGHSWDAYEALGLPAGSSRESVQVAYQKLVAKGDQASLPFFKAAYDAILKSSSTR